MMFSCFVLNFLFLFCSHKNFSIVVISFSFFILRVCVCACANGNVQSHESDFWTLVRSIDLWIAISMIINFIFRHWIKNKRSRERKWGNEMKLIKASELLMEENSFCETTLFGNYFVSRKCTKIQLPAVWFHKRFHSHSDRLNVIFVCCWCGDVWGISNHSGR